jgi:hypothetical protein
VLVYTTSQSSGFSACILLKKHIKLYQYGNKKNNMTFVDRLCFDVTKAVSIFDLGDTKAEIFRLMREFRD